MQNQEDRKLSNHAEWQTVWTHAAIMTCEEDDHIQKNAAIAVQDARIVWMGSMNELPTLSQNTQIIDVQNRLITPGLIDCHTHLIYAGNRANEFALRLQGMDYRTITQMGGGIQQTVESTRNATTETLFELAKKRATIMITHGVTTLEIKSGYGLNQTHEIRMLQIARALGEALPLSVRTTFLGAHTKARDFEGDHTAYIEHLCHDVLPIIAKEKLADAVDIFCENIAFNLDHMRQLFDAASQYQLALKCHAEQLSSMGAAKLAASYRALSVDHLEYLQEDAILEMANSGTVAVLLPGAYYFLQEKSKPPIELLRKHRIPIAIATDYNPGTSPILSLTTVMNMASTLFRLMPKEVWLGVTKHAAKALGVEKDCGTLTANKVANFAIWDAESPLDLLYVIQPAPLWQRVYRGVITKL